MIRVKLEQFEGPLDLLLQLIEERELDISTVSLAEVTDQYLGTLERIERLHPDELADFLVVAAKLLLIKSRILLPGFDAPDEEEGLSLEQQLRLYQMFVAAADGLRRRYRRRLIMFGREHTAQFEPIFSPPARLRADGLAAAFRQVLVQLEPIFAIPETTITRTISLQAKIESIRQVIVAQTAVSFRQLLEQASSRTDVIVTFLALLELVKQRSAVVIQDGAFTDIRIEHQAASRTEET